MMRHLLVVQQRIASRKYVIPIMVFIYQSHNVSLIII